MVWTAANENTFFCDGDRIGLSADARALLIQEGIAEADDLKDKTQDFWDHFFAAMAKPVLQETAPNSGVYRQTPRPHITATSQERLRRASIAVLYYDLVGRPLTLGLLTNNMVDIIWEHVKKLKAKKSDNADRIVPVMGNGKNIQKYLHAFLQYCRSREGSMDIPVKLAWVLRKAVAVGPPGALMPNKPWSREHGSFDNELIARVLHTIIGYDSDNQSIYQLLCDGLRNSAYMSTLETFEGSQDGRGAFFALMEQHMGKSEWRKIVHEANEYFTKATWSGSSSHNPFTNFANRHRQHYNNIVNAQEHVQVTVPDEHTRVTNLLTGCVCTDTEFCTKKSAIQDTEDDTTGPFYNFEQAVACLAPACPVMRRCNKRKFGTISSVDGLPNGLPPIDDATLAALQGEKDDFKPRSGIGKTGVTLQWHNKKDHRKLTKEQKDELRQWLAVNPDAKPAGEGKSQRTANKRQQRDEKKKSFKKNTRREIYAVLGELGKKQKELHDAAVAAATVAATSGASTPTTSNQTPAPSVPPITLNKLLARIEPPTQS